MKQNRYKNQCQRGFSIIEVVVSTLVISVSMLGMTGMQITAKRAGLEAVQRTSATSLTMDLIERNRMSRARFARKRATAGIRTAMIPVTLPLITIPAW